MQTRVCSAQPCPGQLFRNINWESPKDQFCNLPFLLASPEQPEPEQPDEGGCGEGKCVEECPGEEIDLGLEAWEKFGDQCFLWSKKSAAKNWTEAEDFCKLEGGHLVSVTSKAINEYILEGKNKRKIFSLWVGGTDKKEEGFWTWTDCSSFKDHKFTAPWMFSQLDSRRGQDCLDHGMEWNDVKCSGEKAFLCTKKLCPFTCPGGTQIARNEVSNQVLMKKVKFSPDYLNHIIVPQVCDGYQDCPQTNKSNGGEDEDDCGDGESLEISIAGKKLCPA